MARARVRGVELYYELGGANGPPLLFISGSGGDLRQKPSLFDGPLAGAFELLGYDQRGLGQSEVPAGPYTMADYGNDAAALLDAVGWPRCRVIGVSFGGMVAQELALRHPERVERLVLACTSSGGEGGASYPLHELTALGPEERTARSIELADTRMGASWREANPEAFERVAGFYRARAAQAGGPGQETGQRLQFEARAAHDAWARLPALAMPVYLCGGRHDGIAPPANMQAMAQQIPDAKLELFEGGHLFLVQDSTAFPQIHAFLNRA